MKRKYLNARYSQKGLPWNPTRWTLEEDFTIPGPEVPEGLAESIWWDSPDGMLQIRANVWTIKKGFAWDGSSGVSDWIDRKDPKTGMPKTYYASLVHDAGYRYLRQCCSFPYSKAEIDRFFYRLLKESNFRLAWLYWIGVVIFGRFCL